MNRSSFVVLTILIALAAGFIGSQFNKVEIKDAQKQTVYDRVLSSGVLHCGYYVFPPALSMDPNTKEKTGFAVDITNEIAKRLHLKVEWTEEVTFGTMMESLRNKHFDAICTPVWINAAQGREAEYTRDLFYSPIMALARYDDHRFDNDINLANDPSVTLATMDGEITSAIAADDFPKAKTLAIPNNSSLAQLFMNVRDKKADVTFTDPNGFLQFDQSNPRQLRIVSPGKPTRIFPFALAVGKGEFELLSLLNYTLTEMLYSGFIEKTARKHELYPNSYLYTNTPYRTDK